MWSLPTGTLQPLQYAPASGVRVQTVYNIHNLATFSDSGTWTAWFESSFLPTSPGLDSNIQIKGWKTRVEGRKQDTFNSQCSQPLTTLLTSRIHNMVQYTQATQMPRHIYSNGLWKGCPRSELCCWRHEYSFSCSLCGVMYAILNYHYGHKLEACLEGKPTSELKSRSLLCNYHKKQHFKKKEGRKGGHLP